MLNRALTIAAVTAVATMLAAPGLAVAGPQYSAKEIEKHFAIKKPLPREICFGTDSECARKDRANQAKQAAKIKSFDMLITFELGSSELSTQAKENLREWAKALTGKALKGSSFSIDGHTDARGSETFNNGLSERRAATVVQFLEALGVNRDRLVATGHGESNPRDKADPFAAINRRVEATLKIR